MKTIPVRKLAAPKESGRFTLRKLQDLLDEKDLVHELHRHDFYFVLVVEKGMGTHRIDFIDYAVKDHTLFLLRPGQVHELMIKKGAKGYLMEFTPTFFEPGKKTRARSMCQVDKIRSRKLNHVLGYMFEENKTQDAGYETILKANLEIFFTELLRQSASPVKNTGVTTYTQERLEEFLSLLENNFTNQKAVSYYTDAMNLSSFQLNSICKASLGKTTAELINDQIVLEAKRFLLATSSQVKEIADRLGYEDVSYFTRFFKKHTGHSPEVFRNNSR